MPADLPTGGALIARYRDSDEFKRLSEGTQSNCEVHMRRFEATETWGLAVVYRHTISQRNNSANSTSY